ncbi:hypothetical protein EQG68_00560 [Flavobacterium piscinae]|uniref:Uncharacterized protein n=1 Tax=Flavobacterium piscinae TaxID=2506424 RepID=A0A4Q1L0L1_9FLAO|nr:hypothetical protein [Flavobacterium piscinae]RXR35419.1 hypothetical protein EQG68_00560 [Flavobacterium piscinae]
MKIFFKNIREVFSKIKDNLYSKEFAWLIATAFVYEEDNDISFEDSLFDKYGFLFHFFIVDLNYISDSDFKNIIEKVLELSYENINPIEIKKILYHKQLDNLKIKLDKKDITKKIYESQVRKYLGEDYKDS